MVTGERLDSLRLAAITNQGLKVYNLDCSPASPEALNEVVDFP